MRLIKNLIKHVAKKSLTRAIYRKENCPICAQPSKPYDVVDFNKSCGESRGEYLPRAGTRIAYYRCAQCGFCFAPEIARWSPAEFERRIYNDDYTQVDPDWIDARPRANAQWLNGTFGAAGSSISHLDYGGGNGLMAKLLREKGWRSTSYDPFVDRDRQTSDLGKFELITVFEVFEHVPDPRLLVRTLADLLDDRGIILFSTLLSDGELIPDGKLDWWYAAPRNGHISLFSRDSLIILAQNNHFNLANFSPGSHFMWRNFPAWAGQLLPAGMEMPQSG